MAWRHGAGHCDPTPLSEKPNHDADDFKRKQEECRRLEEWIREASNGNSLRVFARGLAHKVNNLLTGIIGNATLARGEVPADSPLQSFLSQIESLGHCIADLAGQILQYAQTARPRLELLSLSALLEEMDSHLKTCISSEVVIEHALSTDLPGFLGDREQICRLIATLYSNAAEAIGGNAGVIIVRAQAIGANRTYLDSVGPGQNLPEGQYLWLEVSDTGCGMDEATRQHLFEPFFSTKFIGRGLGLCAAQGIVRQHAGAIWATSSLDRGSVFNVLIPCSRVA